MFYAAGACILFLHCLCFTAPAVVSAQESPVNSENREIREEINRMRRKIGLDELQVDEAAQVAAAAYAERIATEGRFSHIDTDGNRAVQRYRAAGGASLVAGEVIGKGPNLEAVMQAWRASREHISLILHPLWTHAGAGSVSLPGGGTVWVVVFAEKHLEDISVSFPENGVRIEGTVEGVEVPVAEVNGTRVDIDFAEKPKEETSAGNPSVNGKSKTADGLDAARAGKGAPGDAGRKIIIETDENAFLYFLRFGYLAGDGYPVFTESYRFERP